MSKKHLLCAAASLALAAPLDAAFAQDAAPAVRCESLADFSSDRVVIETATLVPAGPGPSPRGEGPPLPEHCLIQGMIDARVGADGENYGIGFEVRLPTAWNGRFLFQGGGGLDGVLSPALGAVADRSKPSALARGFAVASTDGGHRSESGVDGTWALDQQARVDYGYNALGQATLEAKAVVDRYYGTAPEHSYFMGCSNGGRQALTASQRFPLYFDGIVAGDPAIRFSRLVAAQAWNSQVPARIAPRDEEGRPILSRAFSDGDLQLVKTRLLERCDALDGLADGMINDFLACDFDPGELQCEAEKTDACLTEEQVVALRDLHEGPRNSRGEPLYGAFTYDTGIGGSAWRGMHLGDSESGEPNSGDLSIGATAMRYLMLTPPDPEFDTLSFDFDRDMARIVETGELTDADATYLETFARHGKMIVYNGLSDQGMATGALTDWYERMVSDTGPAGAEAVRLFLIPGMTHCAGGEATDQFDMLDAIVAWVEEGRAPDRVIATGDAFPGVSRPLCPYPQIARYEGGDERDAGSFACRE